MSSTEQLVADIEHAGEEYARFIEVQSDEAFHRRPAPEEWTAAELTGHVAEFPVTFSGQARTLADSPGLRIGRGLDDPGRLAAVEKLAGAGPVDAAAAVRDGVKQAAATLRTIPPDSWQARGNHPRYGEFTVRDIADRFILTHLRDHLEQAKAAVGGS
jgi:hypothetical protein